ncbi:TPR repeat-containing thioredoxin TTL1-like [Bidens hawaiensis]|uniref:TPR repeat-containing thioredoxin TTL1-like n=1 Tax=Bidens hawaiensis TaxID=980011 RepID=UPI00404A3888
MAGPPHHMAGKDTGCGFIGAIFKPKHRKPPQVPRLEASKEHRQTHKTTEIIYTGFTKPIAKHPTPPVNQKKPATIKTKPVDINIKPTYDHTHTPSKSALYSVSQITNISYTKQLRKEPSFTSSELSLRVSVRRTPNSNQIPGHLGNLMKKKPDNTRSNTKLGNIYGNSVKKPDPEVFKNIGNEKYKQGRFDEAIKLYTEAIGIDSTVACYYSNRSAALIGLGKFIDAILDCKIAIRINPLYHRAHHRLGSLYLRFGETEKALCHYKCSGEKAERRDIVKVQAIKAQLVTCSEARKDKDWKRLLKESKFAYSLGADSSLQVHTMQAEALLNLHRHDEACSSFQNAPVIDVNIATRCLDQRLLVTS